jgi:hypothetical protein
MIPARVAKPTANAAGANVSRALHRAASLGSTSAGSSPRRPKKSLIWPTPISTPMPLVKPRITGPGMYLM